MGWENRTWHSWTKQSYVLKLHKHDKNMYTHLSFSLVTPAVVVIGVLASGKYDYMAIFTDDGNSAKM